jgi:hypothetical protein
LLGLDLAQPRFDAAALSTLGRADRKPSPQHSHLIISATELAVDDRRLFGIPGSRFASVAACFSTFDCRETQRKRLVEAVLAL